MAACTCCMFSGAVYAQKEVRHDSSYFVTFPGTVTGRFYFSKKYTSFHVPASDGTSASTYRPNTKLTMGVGATYRNLSLNLAYGFDFLNHDEEKGNTRSIDLQLHLYPAKWSIDLLAESHHGLGLYSSSTSQPGVEGYYYRPDIRQRFIGAAVFRVLNHERFSYNAAMIQNEWQKKSAGTFLFGGHAYSERITADSALITKEAGSDGTPGYSIDKVNFFSFGPGVGYAYTLVIKKHFFVTGSLIGSANFLFSSQSGSSPGKDRFSLNPSIIYKGAIGYNSNTWCVTANIAANTLWVNPDSSPFRYSLSTGNYRIILAKKIRLKKH